MLLHIHVTASIWRTCLASMENSSAGIVSTTLASRFPPCGTEQATPISLFCASPTLLSCPSPATYTSLAPPTTPTSSTSAGFTTSSSAASNSLFSSLKDKTWHIDPSWPTASHVGEGMLLVRLRVESLPPDWKLDSCCKQPTPSRDRPRGRDPLPPVLGSPQSRNAAGPGGEPHRFKSGHRPFKPRRWT